MENLVEYFPFCGILYYQRNPQFHLWSKWFHCVFRLLPPRGNRYVTFVYDSGLLAAEEIKKQFPDIKIIIVTSLPEYSWIKKAKEIGVDSFWYKDENKENIIEIIDRTMNGEHIYPDETPMVKFGQVTNHDLTDRELEILKEMLTGDSNQEIAERLFLSPGTVKRHVENLLFKTGFHTRTELVAEAVRLGIVINEKK